MPNDNNQTPAFGGEWTKKKLDILEKYLDAYTTALKQQPFRLMYIDAFAGAGKLITSDNGLREVVRGSTKIALDISDKVFDKLIFVEEEQERCRELERLKKDYLNRDIEIINSDANKYLHDLDENWTQWRGVLFLDPFATEVKWNTIKKIASFKALDTWILFPISAITRMLPTSRTPQDISSNLALKLSNVFGDESWKKLYRPSEQMDLLGEPDHIRIKGVNEIIKIYKNKLAELFGDRFLSDSKTLKNSRNAPLYELLFCAGNPAGTKIAKRIAKHILNNI